MISLVLALLLPLSPLAGEIIPLHTLFSALQGTSASCYGREYSTAHLERHPNQTVKRLRVKLVNDATVPGSPTRSLEVEVGLKGEENFYKVFRSYLLCPEEAEGECYVECDGGKVKAWGLLKGQQLMLENFGFVLEGGCGGEEETRYLQPSPKGDDLFQLSKLPSAYCQL